MTTETVAFDWRSCRDANPSFFRGLRGRVLESFALTDRHEIYSRSFVKDAGELATFAQRNQGRTIRLSCSSYPSDADEIDRVGGVPSRKPHCLAFEISAPCYADPRRRVSAAAFIQCTLAERFPEGLPYRIETPKYVSVVFFDDELQRMQPETFDMVGLDFERRLRACIDYLDSPCEVFRSVAFEIPMGDSE